MAYSEIWDLESIFAGGTASPALKEKIASIRADLSVFEEDVKKWDAANDKPNYQDFSDLLAQEEKIGNALAQCGSFINCHYSANVADKLVTTLFSKLFALDSEFSTADTILTKKLVAMSQTDWQALLDLPAFKPVAFVLDETREQGKKLLSEAEETLINALSIDGIQAWGDHYDRIASLIEIPFEEADGSTTLLSVGQAYNKMSDDPDAAVRKQLFEKWEQAWGKMAPLFADTLNHLSGFRLALYKAHGTEDFLARPLEYNRMSRKTLDTMWDTITKNKEAFMPFYTRKAQLLGMEKLAWQDVDAPVVIGDATPHNYPYNEGAKFIIDNFSKFGDKLAAFAQKAFENSWIEAEDRPGKGTGGYCTTFPESKESRIFMTYSGSPNGVSTLAHELGHAFHTSVMFDLPALNQEYAMNVAETASTFAEMIVADATVREAKSVEERVTLLDNKLLNASAMFFNIHARFIFENNFYEERKNGVLSEEHISELMEAAQKESYLDALSEYHPHFWASKGHFYGVEVPFYNFPYTFGYLFSLGIYARSLEEGKAFEEKYIALLKDTASMTTEDLAMKHLGVDLTQPDFWQAGIDLMVKDVETFVEITEAFV